MNDTQTRQGAGLVNGHAFNRFLVAWNRYQDLRDTHAPVAVLGPSYIRLENLRKQVALPAAT